MYANFLLGLQDIWKHKIFFGACIAFLVVFSTVIVMIAVSIYVDLQHQRLMEAKVLETFEPVYTRFDLSYDREDLEHISRIYAKNAVSTRESQSLSSSYGRPVALVFGDGSLINPGIVNREGITVYAYDTCDLEYIEILGVEHKIKPILSFAERFQFESYLSFDPFPSPESIFVVYQGEAMVEIIHYMAERNPERFFEIIGNTWILAEDSKRIDDFTGYIKNHVEGISFKDYLYKGNYGYGFFISSYLLPLVAALALTGILSFLVIFQGMLQRMKRDLTIHIQSGARFGDVLLRFCVFFGAIIGITLAIIHIIGVIRAYDYESFIGPVTLAPLLIIAISIPIYIARALKRTNLFDNLRGDMT